MIRCKQCGKQLRDDTAICPFCKSGISPNDGGTRIEDSFINWQKMIPIISALLIVVALLLLYAARIKSRAPDISTESTSKLEQTIKPEPETDLWIIDRVKVDLNKMNAGSLLRDLPDKIGTFESDAKKNLYTSGRGHAGRTYTSNFARAEIKLTEMGFPYTTPHGQISEELKRVLDARLAAFLKKGIDKVSDEERQLNLANGEVYKYLFAGIDPKGIDNLRKYDFYIFSIKGFYVGELDVAMLDDLKKEHIQASDRFVQDLVGRLANDDGRDLLLSIEKARKELISIVQDKKQGNKERYDALFTLAAFPFSKTREERDAVLKICNKITSSKNAESEEFINLVTIVRQMCEMRPD